MSLNLARSMRTVFSAAQRATKTNTMITNMRFMSAAPGTNYNNTSLPLLIYLC